MIARCRLALRRAGVVVIGTFVSLVALTGTASAHAVLEHSNPAADSVVKTAPSAVVLSFDETVLAASDALRVYDDRLDPVKTGSTGHPDGRGDEIGVTLPGGLAAGTYTVTWRVTSSDTHVVSGSFQFSIGHRTTVTGVAPTVGEDQVTVGASGLLRGLGYLGLVAGPGSLVVALWLWPAGLARRRMRRTMIGGGVLLAVVTVLGFAVEGALAAGVPLSHSLEGSALRLGLEGRFGRAGVDRLVLLIALAELVIIVRDERRKRIAVSAGALALAATWPYAGHAASGSLVPLAFVADLVHVAAMTTWLGGLLLLVVGLLPAADEDSGAVVARFSEWALASVVLIVATGLFASWRNVRHWGALTATTYGRLLLIKVGIVVLAIIAAYVTRRRSRRSLSGPQPIGRLRRALAVESGVVVVVLGVTAALTGTVQADEVYTPSFTQSATDAGVVVTVHLDRTRVGTTELTVSTRRASGGVQPIAQITGTLTEVDPPIGPLPITFTSGGPGREVAVVTFPDAGSWQMQLDVRTSAIDEVEVTATVPIR